MYEIIILPATEKEINKLPNDVADAVLEALEKLAVEPKPQGMKQLNNYSTPRLKVRTFHRIKIKKVYRVIYHIENKLCVVSVVKVAHRGKVYKNNTLFSTYDI